MSGKCSYQHILNAEILELEVNELYCSFFQILSVFSSAAACVAAKLIVCMLDVWVSVCHQLIFKLLLPLQFLSNSRKTWHTMIYVPIRKKMEQIFNILILKFLAIFEILHLDLPAAAAVELSRPTGLSSLTLANMCEEFFSWCTEEWHDNRSFSIFQEEWQENLGISQWPC